MTYCRQGHTLVDNEAEAGWDKLPPASFFELVIGATTYFGIVDEYTPPTPTTLICRLYTDAGRTILLATPVATGVPYEIQNFVDYLHDAKDIELNVSQGMGTWRSPPVTIRDDTGVWNGQWIAEPKKDDTVEFNFDGAHTLFKTSVQAPIASEQVGAGLVAGTYEYCIVPVDGAGRLGAGSRKLTVTIAGAADILIDWLPDTQVTQWNIYGRTAAGLGLLITLPGATVSYVDNGTDVPNPALLPPLFEDPAWTPATANKDVTGTDGDVAFIASGTEDGSTKLDDGTAVATYTAIGTVDAQNIAQSLGFDLTDLVSYNSEKTDVVIDPNLFTEDTGPVEALQDKVITYDYAVYIDSNGDTVITESDSSTGQTTTITVNLTDGNFDIVLSDITGILASDSIPINPDFVIPAPGSMSLQTTLSNFRTQSDGTILGDERIEANTYQVTVQTSPGLFVWMDHDFGSTIGLLNYSFDEAQTWANYSISTRLIFPAGFTHNREAFVRAHGEGWTVSVGLNHPTVPSLVTDFSMHWTPDVTANPWPFNDIAGRVASLNITADQYTIVTSVFGTNDAYHTIKTMANGLGPFMYNNHDSGQTKKTSGFGSVFSDFDFFFPATGNFTFVSPGATKYQHHVYWREKNLLIGIDESFLHAIYTNPVVNNPSAPLGPQTFRYNMNGANLDNIYHMGTTKNIAWISWRKTNTYGYSWTTDGSTWNDVIMNNIGDSDPKTPGNEFLGMPPDEAGDPKRDGQLMWLSSDLKTIYTSNDNGVTWNTTVKPSLYIQDIEYDPWFNTGFGAPSDADTAWTPILWNGIALAMPGPRSSIFWAPPSTFQRLDSALVDLIPSPGGTINRGGGTPQDSSNFGTTIGQSGSPNGIPAANLRRYLGRGVVIPLRAVNPPPPWNIRDSAKSKVYGSSRTREYIGVGGSIKATITDGPGGLGASELQRIEDGQRIIINVPGGSETILAAKKPVPINMRWSDNPLGTFP